MSNDPISQQVSQRICIHMNSDHKDSLLIYATQYAGIKDPGNVEMLSINSLAMQLQIDEKVIEIPFEHALVDNNDAHKTLVSMVKPYL